MPTSRSEARRAVDAVNLAEMLRRSLSALRRSFWLVAALLLVFIAAGLAFVELREPYYEAKASLIIDPRVDQGMGASQPTPAALLLDALVVDSEMEVMRSEHLLRRVIERLDLIALVEQDLQEQGEPIPERPVLMQAANQYLLKHLEIERVGTTFVVSITAQAGEPQLAADIANTLSAEYIASQSEVNASRTQELGSWLSGEIDQLRGELRKAESAVTEYINEHDIPNSPDADAVGAVQQELDETESALIAARGRIREVNAEIAAIDRLDREADASLPRRQHQVIVTLGGRDGLPTRDFPAELDRLRESRRIRVDIAEGEIASLEDRAKDLRVELAQLNREQLELRELQRRSEVLQDQYQSILAKAEESQTEGGFYRSNARSIEQAIVPIEPANLDTPVVVAAFGIGGLLLGLICVFLREQFDDTVRRSTDLSDNLDVPYLGPLPTIRDRDLAGLPAHLQVRGLKRATRRELKLLTAAAAAPLSMLTESMRRALFELKRMDRREDAGPHLVAITSMLAGEGKSFFASNFAFFLAQQGLRVVLADGDIRKSHLTSVFGEVLAESSADCHAPFQALAPNLLFAPAPGDARHSIEDHLRDMLRRSGPIDPPVDVVVLDTSPVAYVADALLISSRIDSAILVVRSGVTAVSTLQRFLEMNQPIADKLIGTCLSQSGSLRTRPYEFIPSSSGYYWPPPGRAGRRRGLSWKRKANGA